MSDSSAPARFVDVPRPRIALYGHDSLGLGHVRRNLALATALAASPEQPDVLILCGALEAATFELPDGVEVMTMPGVRKDALGRYRSRRLRVGLDEALALRRGVLQATLESFEPDLMVVDKTPRGLGGELEPALRLLHRNVGTGVVLGLRDVLDEPAAARREWRDECMSDAVRRHVDEIWIYGDASVHDLASACGIPPALRRRIRYTGYLAAGRITEAMRPPCVDTATPYVLCTVGGGQDGVELASAFVHAELPDGIAGVLVTGAQMPARDRMALREAASARADVAVMTFHRDVARWIPHAAAVVTMGGYNTVAEILSTDVPGLIAPRLAPRAEQAHRAHALARLGHVDVLEAVRHRSLTCWLAEATQRPRVARTGIDLDGLTAVREHASRLLRHRRLRAVAG